MFKDFHGAAVRNHHTICFFLIKITPREILENTTSNVQKLAAQQHEKIPSSIVTGLVNAIQNFKSNACGASKRKLLIVLNDVNALISPDKKVSIPLDDDSSSSSSSCNTMKTPPKIKIRIQDLTKEKQEEISGHKPRSTLNLTWDQPVENPENLGFCPLCDNSSHKSTLISCSKPGCPGIFHVKCVKVKTKPFLCSWCSKKRNERKYAKKISVFFPNQKTSGAHINISGAAVTKYSKNQTNAIRFIEYLASDAAQELYAQANHEYPIRDNITVSEIVESWGYPFKKDTLNLDELGKNNRKAVMIFDRVGWK